MAKNKVQEQEVKEEINTGVNSEPENPVVSESDKIYSKEEAQILIDQAVFKAIQAERDRVGEFQSIIPVEYVHIDRISSFANDLKAEQQVLTHEREKSIRWFVDKLRELVNRTKNA